MATAAFEDIVETFAFLGDWEGRYAQVIDMGRAMPPLAPGLKTDGARVHGCASHVWLVPRLEGTGPDARIAFDGESDAMIVRGLIAILRSLVNGMTARDLMQIDVTAEMARLGLHEHLSAQRSNGLRAMVTRMKDIAAATAAETEART